MISIVRVKHQAYNQQYNTLYLVKLSDNIERI